MTNFMNRMMNPAYWDAAVILVWTVAAVVVVLLFVLAFKILGGDSAASARACRGHRRRRSANGQKALRCPSPRPSWSHPTTPHQTAAASAYSASASTPMDCSR